MSENSSAEDKTEQATPRRLEQAREKGQVASSKDLNTSIMLIAGSAGILMFGSRFIEGLSKIMQEGFQIDRKILFQDFSMVLRLAHLFEEMLVMLLPFCIILVIAAFIGPLAMSGFSIKFNSIALKFDRMNPLSGLKRIFALRGVVEMFKAMAKFMVVAFVSILIVWNEFDSLLSVSKAPLNYAMISGMHLIASSFLAISATTLIIALADVPYQLWEHAKKLRMTKKEIKDEHKESEGNPEMRAEQRRAQQEMAKQRMMEEVPNADVVITNPTHYAVAIVYDSTKSDAPRVVAKGKDLIAEQIKKVAINNDVALVSSPPLARSIFFTTKINQEIPAGLYIAVAQILAYVYQLKRYRRGLGVKPGQQPEVTIPKELEYEAEE